MKTILLIFGLLISCSLLAQEKMVKVNGQSFHVWTQGIEDRNPETPVVIFENGMGVDLGNWKKIIETISTQAPVFAYDRAGVGKSEVVYQMPSPEKAATSLHDLLAHLEIAPPYILVGHSLGGVFIRSFAGRFPQEIFGLLFIDPADFTETKEDWNDLFRALEVPEKKIDEMMNQRLYTPAKVDSLHYGPWSERQMLTELRRTDFSELRGLPLPQVPIIFLVGGKFEVPIELRSKDYDHDAFFHLKNDSNMERWRKLIYSSSKGGSLIFLTNAGHYIHWDDPETVIQQIQKLLQNPASPH